MVSIFIGLIAFVLGVIGLFIGWDYFLNFIYGFLPVSLFMAGLIAIIAGIAGLRDHQKSKKDEEKLNKEQK